MPTATDASTEPEPPDTTTAGGDSLEEEIHAVRRRGMERIDLRDSRYKQLELPILTEFAARYRPDEPRTEAIAALISDAIDGLPEGLAKKTLVRLFGIDRNLLDDQPDRWRKQAQQWHPPMNIEQFRRSIEGNLVAHLTDAVRGLTDQLPPATTGTAGYITTYIQREEYEHAFTELLNQGHDAILLWGQPGSGKTRLADDLTSQHASSKDEIAWIRCYRPSTQIRDLYNACVSRGIDIDSHASTSNRAMLAALVQSEQAPEFVVLDGVVRADDLAWMLPTTKQSRVVATSWAKTIDLRRCGILRVRRLTDTQTDDLVKI
ncbi:MAG: hypothetical protein ACRD3Q_08385, partial [Terriglobales bacterium]